MRGNKENVLPMNNFLFIVCLTSFYFWYTWLSIYAQGRNKLKLLFWLLHFSGVAIMSKPGWIIWPRFCIRCPSWCNTGSNLQPLDRKTTSLTTDLLHPHEVNKNEKVQKVTSAKTSLTSCVTSSMVIWLSPWSSWVKVLTEEKQITVSFPSTFLSDVWPR